LLAATCWEQQGRFHTLQLLREYLSGCAGRRHQIVASEIKALQELYDATWCELAHFPPGWSAVPEQRPKRKTPVANALQAT
jgi:hypothetical protein